jgi:hypothetical protein
LSQSFIHLSNAIFKASIESIERPVKRSTTQGS